MLSKKLFSEAALHRRCIVFSDEFYEWHHHFAAGKKGHSYSPCYCSPGDYYQVAHLTNYRKTVFVKYMYRE